jgi:hypothetical protein
VSEDHPNLRLDMNLAAMSETERAEAETTLRQALKRLATKCPQDDPSSH